MPNHEQTPVGPPSTELVSLPNGVARVGWWVWPIPDGGWDGMHPHWAHGGNMLACHVVSEPGPAALLPQPKSHESRDFGLGKKSGRAWRQHGKMYVWCGGRMCDARMGFMGCVRQG